ncbi:MAG: hypothetical protein JXB25_13070 [Deltaproteobacteria bacterium]|nr:hypothetical protein [Deltaproteobacteria bacterium]
MFHRFKGIAIFTALLASGCGLSTQIPASRPSGLEQFLMARALERAVAQLDLARFSQRTIWVDACSLSGAASQPERVANHQYAERYLLAELKRAGAKMAPRKEEAELQLQVFFPVLGIDHAESSLGLPAIPVPLTGISTPPLDLYRADQSSGHGKITLYAFDRGTGELLENRVLSSLGQAHYDRYKILLILGYTHTDIFKTNSDPEETKAD